MSNNETWVSELDESIFETKQQEQSLQQTSLQEEEQKYKSDLEKLCLTDEYLETLQEEIKFRLDVYKGQLEEVEELEGKAGEEFKDDRDILVKLVDYLEFQYGLVTDSTIINWFKEQTYNAVESKIGKEGVTLAANAIEAIEDASRECIVMGDNLQEYIINTCAKQFPDLLDADAIKEMFVTPTGNNTIN